MADRMSPLSDREILVQISADTTRLYDAVFGSQGKAGLLEDVALIKARIGEFNTIYAQGQEDQAPLLREHYQLVSDVEDLKSSQVGKKQQTAQWGGVGTAIGLALLAIIQGLTGMGEK